jgi:hypothetical protein
MITILNNEGQPVSIDHDLLHLLKKEFENGTKQTFISVKSGVHVIEAEVNIPTIKMAAAVTATSK